MNHTTQQLDLGEPVQGAMRGQLRTPEAARRFIEAGNATLTLCSRASGQRFTFKFSRPEEDESHVAAGKPRPVWVKLLSGPDNTANFSFIGTLFPPRLDLLRFSARSRVSSTAPAAMALIWMIGHLYGEAGNPAALLRQAELWHEGRCGRCGRKLTVPASIATGFGPDCASQMESA